MLQHDMPWFFGYISRQACPNVPMTAMNAEWVASSHLFSGFAMGSLLVAMLLSRHILTLFIDSPEIVQSQPYGEKADVWAIGCILYQMCSLRPPFHTNNLLALSSKIVGGTYEPLPEGTHSQKVSDTITK